MRYTLRTLIILTAIVGAYFGGIASNRPQLQAQKAEIIGLVSDLDAAKKEQREFTKEAHDAFRIWKRQFKDSHLARSNMSSSTP